MNKALLFPDLKAGLPEVKPGTGSLIFTGTIVLLSAALLLRGLWASTAWAHSLLQEVGEHDSGKTQNGFFYLFPYQPLPGQEEGKWGSWCL